MARPDRFISTVSSSRHPRTSARERPDSSRASTGSRLLIDDSVWARLATSSEVADAFRALVSAANPTDVFICPPVVAEYGFSSRTGADHTTLMDRLTAFPECPLAPTSAEVLRLQNALWTGGLLRAVGAMDTLIAAYGIANGATVIHYNGDFDHVGEAWPAFAHRWILPRGTL